MKQIIYFTAKWCGPCRTLGPVMEGLSSELNIRRVDVDQDRELSTKYGIRSVPALVLVNEAGEEIKRSIGVQYREVIKEWYNG